VLISFIYLDRAILIRLKEPVSWRKPDLRTRNFDFNQIKLYWNWESQGAERSLDKKVELKQFRLRTKTLSQFQITYWRRISSWTISSSSTGSTRNQDQFVFVFVETNQPGFFSRCFMSDKGNEVSLISYRTSDVIGID